MRITLIEHYEYDMLMKVQAEHPNLTYQNKGYDYPDKSKWTPEDLEAFKKCEDFLKQCIKGFREFNHFILRNSGKMGIRFQYNWTADEEDPNKLPFTGVGYLEVQELLNGFNENQKKEQEELEKIEKEADEFYKSVKPGNIPPPHF